VTEAQRSRPGKGSAAVLFGSQLLESRAELMFAVTQSQKESRPHPELLVGRKIGGEILARLSFPKTLMSQGRGQRIFSARSRACGPFQLFCFAPKTEVFTRQ
jgi:hypothetical protein